MRQPRSTWTLRLWASTCGLVAGACGVGEALEIESRIRESATLEVWAPRVEVEVDCAARFESRFCREQLEPVGRVTIRGGQGRALTLRDDFDETCTNVLWLRLIRLDDVGPVDDPGTLFELPARAEIEYGAGAEHTVAFPVATVRIDEVGEADANQGGPPSECARAALSL